MSSIAQLMLAISVVGSNSLALGPIAPAVAISFSNTSATDVMVASALFGFGTAAGALALAPRADHVGLTRALKFSLLLLMIGFAISAMAPSLWLLCAGQLLAGIASGVALPCTYGLAAEISPPGKENETLGRVLLGWMLSMVIGVSVASIIADTLHWRMVYALWVAGAGTVLFGITRTHASMTTTHAPSAESVLPEQKPLGRSVGSTRALWVALNVPGVISGLVSVAAFMMAFYGVYGFIGTHITLTLGSSTAIGGAAALIYGIGFGLATPLDKWLDRYEAIYSRAIVFSVLVFIYLLLALASFKLSTLMMMCLAWGAANHIALNLLIARLTAIDPKKRAAIMGLYSATTYLAMFVGTLLFKLIYEAHTFWALGVSGAALLFPLTLFALNQARNHDKDALPE